MSSAIEPPSVANLNAPTVTKSFTPAVVGTSSASTLTITLANSNAAAITGVAFTDTYPAGLVNATTPAATSSCGGTVTAAAGGATLSLVVGAIPANGCTVTVSVLASTAGNYVNTLPTGAVTSANAAPQTTTGRATLTVSSKIVEQYLEELVLRTIPILAYDQAAAEWHAHERARLVARGQTPSFADGQIAAIARVHDLTVVTFNVADFKRFDGLSVTEW